MFKIQFEIKSKMTAYVWAISGYERVCPSGSDKIRFARIRGLLHCIFVTIGA